MRHNRVLVFLTVILGVSCLILGITLLSINIKSASIPDKAIEDLVSILEKEDIHINPELVSSKITSGRIYVCESDEYNTSVSELIGGSKVMSVYSVPNGEIIYLTSGERFEFYKNFSFKYSKSGEDVVSMSQVVLDEGMENLTGKALKNIGSIAIDFLDSGSLDYAVGSGLEVDTVVRGMWEKDGKHYALCSREINGNSITGNLVLCTISGGEVVEAYGTWCFLNIASSYSAQLYDSLNILFNVKKEISAIDHGRVEIQSVDLCYSLYFLGDDREFCLIPCWQIITDSAGEFIYNAINGTLYTKK